MGHIGSSFVIGLFQKYIVQFEGGLWFFIFLTHALASRCAFVLGREGLDLIDYPFDSVMQRH
jgi:hypothetical protein